MSYFWQYLIIIMVTGAVCAGSIYLGMYLSDMKKKMLNNRSDEEKAFASSEKKRKGLIKAYFELKDNIIVFSNTLELVKKGDIKLVKRQLSMIKVDQTMNLAKDIKLDKDEFEIIDELYMVRIIKNKIEFHINIVLDKKMNMLEFRAEIDESIEELKAVEKKMKVLFDSIG